MKVRSRNENPRYKNLGFIAGTYLATRNAGAMAANLDIKWNYFVNKTRGSSLPQVLNYLFSDIFLLRRCLAAELEKDS